MRGGRGVNGGKRAGEGGEVEKNEVEDAGIGRGNYVALGHVLRPGVS